MSRIFSVLAAISLLLLIANLVLGLLAGDYNGAAARYRSLRVASMQLGEATGSVRSRAAPEQADLRELGERLATIDQWNNMHVLLGITAALVTLLVNSVTVTYFIGTARWCQEVVDTYELDRDLIARSRWLKRRTFPWALASILAVIAIIVLGGAAHPFLANAAHADQWVVPHLAAAIAGVFLIGWSYVIQVGKISSNYRVIEEVMHQVQQVRGDGDAAAPP